MENIVDDETESVLDTGQSAEGANSQNVEDFSKTESISELVPSKIEYSITDSENVVQEHTSQGLLNVNVIKDKSASSSLNFLPTHSNDSNKIDQEPSKHSWNLDAGQNTHLSKESPVNLAISSDSKDTHNTESIASQSSKDEEQLVKKNEGTKLNQPAQTHEEELEECDSKESLGSEYLDSLNEDVSNQTSNENIVSSNVSNDDNNKIKGSSTKSDSDSEEIIKLDIRGHGMPKFPIQAAKIIFGPPPEGSVVVDANMEPMPAFQNLLSPFLVGASDGVKVEEIYEENEVNIKPTSLDKSPVESLSSDKTEKDLLIEEMTVECSKEKENDFESLPAQPKSLQVEDTVSLTTLTTDYKTICDEYEAKVLLINWLCCGVLCFHLVFCFLYC